MRAPLAVGGARRTIGKEADRAGRHEDDHAERGDEEPDRVDREVRDGRGPPRQMTRASTIVSTKLAPGSRGEPLGAGGRHHQQGEDEQRAGDLADLGGRAAEQHEEHRRQQPHRHAAGTWRRRCRRWRRTAAARSRASTTRTTTATTNSVTTWRSEMPEEGAEQQAGEAVEESAVEADEQHAAGQRERLHRPDDRGLLAVAPGPSRAVAPPR